MSQLVGQRVVARDNAQMVGSVRRLHLDPGSARIVSIELDGVSDAKPIVEWPAVIAIGGDGVVIASSTDRHEPLDAREQQMTSAEVDLTDKLVLLDSGDAVGNLKDIVFDEKTGRINELVVHGHSLVVDRVIALGSYALIVPAPVA